MTDMPGQRRPDERKFREMLLYVASALGDDPAFGATKLNKVLYYAEFGHVRATGHPISGVEFQKLPQGPAPRRLLPVRSDLIGRGEARMEQRTYLGFAQERLVPLRAADLSLFTEDEIESIDQAIAALRPMTATQTSEVSHEEVGWQLVDEGEMIPYETAFLRPMVVTPAIRRHAESLVDKLGLRP